jgi:hypothetical protein
MFDQQSVEKRSGGTVRRWKTARNAHLLPCKLRFLAIFRLARHPPERGYRSSQNQADYATVGRLAPRAVSDALQRLRQDAAPPRPYSLMATLHTYKTPGKRAVILYPQQRQWIP